MSTAARLHRWLALVWFALFAPLVLPTASAQDEFVIGVLRMDAHHLIEAWQRVGDVSRRWIVVDSL